MQRRYLLPAALLAAAVFAATSWAVSTKTTFDLKGEVYASGFKIELKNRAGADLKRIKAGTYTIKVEDKSTIHDFHLTGPGVNKSTTVGGIGEKLWTVTLKRGTYQYFCDPHAATMHGSFTVI
ncbi:MAG TPA: plastocyanin/azurin family copper-binding protein [Gaiellaceae bacterium]|jgi:plastocyanin|nr:plastocyanin/azurin family copper-binding protein [Gaiellaceae bacterium]